MSHMKFLVTIERDELGWIVADCPALPGCVTQGRTVDEALVNVREAIEVSIETRRAQGLPLAVDVVEVEVEAPAK